MLRREGCGHLRNIAPAAAGGPAFKAKAEGPRRNRLGSSGVYAPLSGAAQMGKVNDENVRTGQQETNEPWKKPDHSDHHPDKDSPSPRPRRAEDNKTS